MKKTFVLYLVVLFALTALASVASAKKVNKQRLQIMSMPRLDAPLPPDLAGQITPLRSAAAADTFVLLDEDFDTSNGDIANLPGWSTVDRYDQIDTFWHVADGTELNGGTYGNLLPLSGGKSMWCGVNATTATPYRCYSDLPGYGNDWDQILESTSVAGDSIRLSYKVFWDSEAFYDGTVVEYSFDGGSIWSRFAITDTLSYRTRVYDGISPSPFITETLTASGPPGGDIKVRFRFTSDVGWSDEDGLWPTDGAIMLDDITLQTWAAGSPVTDDTESFEAAAPGSNVAGLWTGKEAPAFGDYAALYPGVTVTQEDPCEFNALFLWGFFDDPMTTPYTCHTPNPLPGQGAMPFGTDEGVYMENEIWSPPVPNIGSGLEYIFSFLVYRDLPFDNLQFYSVSVRTWTQSGGGPPCPGPWARACCFYGGQKDWLRSRMNAGAAIDPTAVAIQVAVGVVDMCVAWCNIYGSGACHSHAPLVDDFRLERIGTFGPQFGGVGVFQDNFAGDGTLTGTARADVARDILPRSSPGIQPADSIGAFITSVWAPEGAGPSAWIYARVQNGNDPKSGPGLGSSDTRPGKAGNRWPHVGSWLDANGMTWEIFQMDSTFWWDGNSVDAVYCVDLNDDLFVPGDTIWYFLGADDDGTPNNGTEMYVHRTLQGQGPWHHTPDREEAAASGYEFTILPAGGFNRGGDILYVDHTDDRGGPAQLFFDSAFDMLRIGDQIDRYDVPYPSSMVGNSLASRVKDSDLQIINNYKTIIWDSGPLSVGTVGDGNRMKEDDWGLLFRFLNTSGKAPGLYLSGDDLAEEWTASVGPGAIQVSSLYMNFDLLNGDHIHHGEAVSPTLTATGDSFIHQSVPDELVVFGGCPVIHDFDVLSPTGTGVIEFPYPNSGDGAVISQQTTNAANQTATVVLSGFGYYHIRDASLNFPPARVEHLKDILTKMGTAIDDNLTGVKPSEPLYVNSLGNNYPNPFNPVTTIRYSIKERAHVSLKVYNAAGQLVRTLIDEVQAPDEVKPVEWDGNNNGGHTVSSGVYFYKMVTKNFAQTKKMVLLK